MNKFKSVVLLSLLYVGGQVGFSSAPEVYFPAGTFQPSRNGHLSGCMIGKVNLTPDVVNKILRTEEGQKRLEQAFFNMRQYAVENKSDKDAKKILEELDECLKKVDAVKSTVGGAPFQQPANVQVVDENLRAGQQVVVADTREYKTLQGEKVALENSVTQLTAEVERLQRSQPKSYEDFKAQFATEIGNEYIKMDVYRGVYNLYMACNLEAVTQQVLLGEVLKAINGDNAGLLGAYKDELKKIDRTVLEGVKEKAGLAAAEIIKKEEQAEAAKEAHK